MRRLLFSLLFVLPLASAQAEGVKGYLKASSISPTLITPPPAPDSEQYKQEIAEIIRLQENPSPEEIKAAEDEIAVKPEMVVQVLGDAYNRKNATVTFGMLDRIGADVRAINNQAKEYWNTERPYQAERAIKPLIQPHYNPAYPSGHTSTSYVWAEVLCQALPEQCPVLRARAEKIAWHRVLTGMHFPSDLNGGRQIALLIMGSYTQTHQFQHDLKMATAELRLIANQHVQE